MKKLAGIIWAQKCTLLLFSGSLNGFPMYDNIRLVF